MLIHGPGVGFKHISGAWNVSKFSVDALRPPVTSTTVCKRTIRPGKCLPLGFIEDSGITVSGISSLEGFGAAVISISSILTVEGLSSATSNNTTIIYITYTILTLNSHGVSATISYPSPHYYVLLNSGAVLTITKSNIASDILDAEIFNNDPDVAVDEYVLIFKRKP